jgi:NAD(P)-dependent dehydrogenase (short-subunit alcohol dehydrogenase family)
LNRQVSPHWPPPGNRLAGKVCIVTGAGSRGPGIGNGRAISIVFAREGAGVVLVDHRRERVDETLAFLNDAERAKVRVVEADVSVGDDCSRVVAETVRVFGRLDVLVNNVGIAGPAGNIVEVDMADWERAMRVNLGSMALMAKHAIPVMASQGAGSIVNISSSAGLTGGFPSVFYPVSKGAVVPLTRLMALQHGPQGVRVNCVAPGLVYTPMVATRGMSAEIRERRRQAAALSVEGDGWDVAYAVLYLAGEEARWVTGVVIPVDGGLVLGGQSEG